MSTQHTAERAAEYRTAYNEGREARRAGQRIGENPYRYGRADLAMHWRDGWEEAAGVQSGPPAAPNRYGHRFEGWSDSFGYGLCSGCGCRENTDAAVEPCPEPAHD